MPELTTGRMFGAYGASMDAALADKAKDIEPHLVPGLIIDRGCGTGALMEYLARRKHTVVGVEISDTLTLDHVGVVHADINAPVFADGFASNVILSSVLHEVYSYKGYSLYPVLACLANCAREIHSGGRIIIRDIWSPESNIINNVRMFMGKSDFDKAHELSSYQMKNHPIDNDLNMFDYVFPDNRESGTYEVVCGPRFAVEFLSKKDYTGHWKLELAETYTSVKISELREMAASIGLKVIYAEPIVNNWIMKNRWKKNIKILMRDKFELYTNQLIVLEKP